jgi:DNA-binding Xre family transcriptional regulator
LDIPVKKTADSIAFANVLGETFQNADEQRAFERDVIKLVAFAELLKALDDIREAGHVSKAELARRVGIKPSVVSRLFNGEGKNVQLDTVADVADALDVYLDVRIRRQPKRNDSRHAPIEISVAA